MSLSRKRVVDGLIQGHGWLRARAPGLLTRPVVYYLYITGRCNLDCSFCWQREDDHRKPGWRLSTDSELTPEAWREVVRELPAPSVVGLSGGEATLSPAFGPILEEATTRGLTLTLNTNGSTLTPRNVDRILGSSIANVSVSIDGFADVHDASRGAAGLFDRIVRGVQRLRTAPCSGRRPAITVKTNILDGNLDQLERFRDFCERELGAADLVLSFLRVGDQAQVSLKYCDDLSFMLADQHAGLHPYERPEALVRVLSGLLEGNRRARCQVSIYPRMSTPDQIEAFVRRQGRDTYRPCLHPWSSVVALPDGTVVPCLSLRLGSLAESDHRFADAMGERYLAFLDQVSCWGEHLPAACNLCCFLRVRT